MKIISVKTRWHNRKTAAALPPVHGLAVFHRLPDAVHPVKTNKRQRREFILSRAVFCFHYARGLVEWPVINFIIPKGFYRTEKVTFRKK